MNSYPTGSTVFDEMLEGGYEPGIISCVYGPAGSGKSNVTLLAVANSEKKVIFVDPEGSFSAQRLEQLHPAIESLLERVLLIRPSTFEKQTEIILSLPQIVSQDVELIIVDSIAALYRSFLAIDSREANAQLSSQMNSLFLVASEYNIPVLITSQVYADMDSDGVHVVGGDIVKYSCKCLIELKNDQGKRFGILKRHRFLPPGTAREFTIDNVGIHAPKVNDD